MSGLRKLAAYIAANKVARSLTGWGSWFLSSWLYDNGLYPIVIAIIGPIYGGIIMATIAITICWFWLKGMVASQNDWFSMDVLHKIQKVIFWTVRIIGNVPFVKQLWIEKIETVLTFLVLCIYFDPMIATLFFRHGDKSPILSKKDIKIFFASGVISNLYWTLRCWGIVLVLKYVWRLMF